MRPFIDDQQESMNIPGLMIQLFESRDMQTRYGVLKKIKFKLNCLIKMLWDWLCLRHMIRPLAEAETCGSIISFRLTDRSIVGVISFLALVVFSWCASISSISSPLAQLLFNEKKRILKYRSSCPRNFQLNDFKLRVNLPGVIGLRSHLSSHLSRYLRCQMQTNELWN